MLSFLTGTLRAILAGILYTILTLGIAIGILLFGVFWWIVPHPTWRRKWMCIMLGTGTLWGDLNQGILWLTLPIKWDIQGLDGLSKKKSYILIANHQSWMDIAIVQTVFNRKTPFCRYFMKKELLRIPIVSWACWMLDFPFMQRYSRAMLRKHPELKNKDIETAKRSCEKFKEFPVTLVNFVEGTRFSFAKRDQKNLSYKHLLTPKGSGVAFALATMGDTIHEILNVTIVYPVPEPVLWDFFTGKIPSRITVRIEKIPITPDLIWDNQGDSEFRHHFQLWLNGVWKEKDALISTLICSKQLDFRQGANEASNRSVQIVHEDCERVCNTAENSSAKSIITSGEDMKLYYSKGACSLAVRIAIHEISVPCEFEAVNLQTKVTEKGEDFLSTNPKGAVPTLLLDNKEILTENAVIQQYLADTFKASSLLPPVGDMKRYHALEWLNYVSTEMHKGFSPLFNSKISEAMKEDIFRPILKSKLSFLNQHLSQQKYLLSNEFTLADGYLFVVLRWLPHGKFNIEDWPNLVRYFNEVKNRPAVQKALQEEGL